MQVAMASCEKHDLKELTSIETKRRRKRGRGNLAIIILTSFLGFFFKAQDIIPVIVGILIGTFTAIATPNETCLVINQNYKKIVIKKYTSGIASLSLFFIVIFLFKIDSNITSLIAIATERASYLIQMVKDVHGANIKKEKIEKNTSLPIPSINISVLISTSAVFGYNRLDQIYIYAALSSEKLGVYFSTLKLFEIANLLIITVITSNLHIMADGRQKSENASILEKKIFLISIALVIFISFIAPLALNIIFKITTTSFTYIYVIAIGTLCGAIGTIKGPWVAKNNRFKINAIFTILGAFTALFILIFGKPQQLETVALSMSLSQLTVNILLPFFVKEERSYILSIINWKHK